jgi:hypothetical protein
VKKLTSLHEIFACEMALSQIISIVPGKLKEAEMKKSQFCQEKSENPRTSAPDAI